MIQRKARSDTEISKLIKQAKWNHTDWKSGIQPPCGPELDKGKNVDG